MTQLTQIAAATRMILAAWRAMDVPHYVGGSVASSLHGRPRTTIDVDLAADMEPEHVAPLIQALGDDYYADEAAIRDAIRHRRAFNVIHLATMLKIDVFPLHRRFDRSALSRVVLEHLDEESISPLPVASPEDIIVYKLEWYRLGGEISERQWDDLLQVLRMQGPSLDNAYLERWAGELGVDDLLRRARTEAAKV